jgi:chromate transporter
LSNEQGDNAKMTAPTTLPRAHPASLSDLFLAFTVLALQGFGGVLAVIQREMVERKRWLTQEEFLEDWAVAQIMPGPNVCNIALMIGDRYFGLRGALTALAGMLAVPLLVVLGLAVLHSHYAHHPGVEGALRGMAAVAAGMITATGVKLAAALRTHPLPWWQSGAAAVLCVVCVVIFKLPLIWVLLLGGVCVGLTWRVLQARQP